MQRIYPICYRQPQITEASLSGFWMEQLVSSCCFTSIRRGNKYSSLGVSYRHMLGASHPVTVNIHASSSPLLSGFWEILSTCEDTVIFNSMSSLLKLCLILALQKIPDAVLWCNSSKERVWYCGRGRGQTEQRPLFQGWFPYSVAP